MPTHTVDGITWNYELNGSNATIGDGTTNANATTTGINTSGAITIPATVGAQNYPVTSIADYAFNNYALITSVTIPNSVTSIGTQGFYGTGLTSVTIPASVTSLGVNCFSNCTNLVSFTLPSSPITLGAAIFQGTGFTSFTFPDNSVTSIPLGCFNSCSNLTTVTLGNSVTNIGRRAFLNTNLQSINIPPSVTTIDSEGFSSTPSTLVVTMNTQTISGTTYTSPTTSDITFFGRTSVTLVLPPPPLVLVSGKVPNWLQPKSGQYNATMGGYESQFLAWCSPTSAANQLGHLVVHGGVTQPTNINDGIDAGNDSPVALASSTIPWDSGYGWGDYMLDGPTYRGKNLFNGVVSDFGWHMNTNNLGPLGAGAGSAVGTTLQNIYNGMVEFYQQVGYTNMVGMVYHFNGSIQNFGVDPAYWTANGHTAGAGVSADYTITLDTIKHEIDNNRTVMACFNGWNITPAGHADLTGMTSGEDETGIYQTLGEFQPEGPHGEQFNIASTDGGNIESYNAGLGHTVLIVGYINAGTSNDPTGNTNWLVVRDNFTTTHKNVIIPFVDLNNLLATVYVNHTTAAYNAISLGGTDYGDIGNATTVSFSTNTLTIENTITNTDTDSVQFVLPAYNDMETLNVTNFSGTGTITYTLATGGSTVTSGTFTTTGTNLLAGNALIVTVDTTYVLTLTADAAITYTIVGTSILDYPATVVEREYPPAWVRNYIGNNTNLLNNEGTGTNQWGSLDVSITVNDANETYGQGTYILSANQRRSGGGAGLYYITSAFNGLTDPIDTAWGGPYLRGWYANLTNDLMTNPSWDDINWIDLENGNATGTISTATLTIEFPESFQPTKFQIWSNALSGPIAQILFGYDEVNDIYDRLVVGNATWTTSVWDSDRNTDHSDLVEHNITQTTPKSYKKYAVSSDNGNLDPEIWAEIRLIGLFEETLTVINSNFVNNTLTIENSIYAGDHDTVTFILPNETVMPSLNVTEFVGTGTINYTISATGVTDINGTISAIGDNLLAGNLLVASAGDVTYTLRLSASTTITKYKIVGTKIVDYGTTLPTTLTFSNNILTIENTINTTDTDVINFVLPAGYNISLLDVTTFNGTGNASYTLTKGGNTIVSGTFSAISSNLLTSEFPIFALNTDVTYTLTITADATLSYQIVGTKAITNISNYSATQISASGFSTQDMIDAGVWDTDTNANRLNASYTEGFVDISGNVKVTGSIVLDTGDVDLNSVPITDMSIFSADVPVDKRLFVVGDVLMGDSSLNILNDISINGVLSVGSYKPASISVSAINGSGGGGGYSTSGTTTTFTEDYTYLNKIQFNGDVSSNAASNYFGPNTTIKVNNGIEFTDSSTLHSTNKETNGTTFKASTFNNMTVLGDFASNPQLTPSDYRIKNNVETLDESHIVDNLRPVKYKQTQNGKNDIGFLAHEVQEHYPELVEGEKDGDKLQSINYNGLLPILINEVQQLKKQIAETRERIHSERS